MGGSDSVAGLVVEEITTGDRFRQGVATLAEGLGQPVAGVTEAATASLREMVAVQTRPATDMLGRLGRFGSRAYTVEVDGDALEGLRKLAQRHVLVFLPSHKSYLDPFVLRGVLERAGLPMNYVLGGVNVSFWPVGPIARRSGIVFIRRTVKDDAVYKFALRQYLGHLVERRFNLEWYIEGGRSRTGKLRPPRLGILAYLIEAFEERGADERCLVPVSIVYDQLHEVGAMAAEEHGGEKRPEGLRWMLGYARAQGQHLGKAYVNFGEPLSLDEARHGPRKLSLEKIAFEVCHRINRVTPVTPTSLLTLALLGLGDRALTANEIRSVLNPLLDYVAARQLPQAATFDLRSPAGLDRALETLVRRRVVTRFAGGAAPVYAIGEEQHLVAAYSRNSVIHFFVTRAITELVLVHLATAPPTGAPRTDLTDDAWAEALRLRDLLKYEFFFPTKTEFAEELRTELSILDPAWEEREHDPEAVVAGLAALPLHLGHRVLGSFLEAYQVVADRLAARPPGKPVEEKEFLAECLGVGQQYRLQHRIHSTESISQELFRTALALAAGRGLLDPAVGGADGLTEPRAAFAAELGEVVERIGILRRLAVDRLREESL